MNYKNIFTDSFGNYNYTLTAPSAGTYTVKVNSTWANTITGEQLATLRVTSAPVINNDYTSPTYPRFNQNTTLVINVTDVDPSIVYVNFTLVAPNGTKVINNTNGTKGTGDLYNVSFNLTSYGTWLWNVSIYDNDGFIVNTTTLQIILMEVTENLNASTVFVNNEVAVSGKINLSNGTNVSYNLIQLSSNSAIRWRWYDNISDSVLHDFRFPVLINSSAGRTQAPVSVTGRELNGSIAGMNLTAFNTTTFAVVDALGAETGDEIFGHRLKHNFNDAANDGYLNITDSIEWNADISANTRKLYYIYYEANQR